MAIARNLHEHSIQPDIPPVLEEQVALPGHFKNIAKLAELNYLLQMLTVHDPKVWSPTMQDKIGPMLLDPELYFYIVSMPELINTLIGQDLGISHMYPQRQLQVNGKVRRIDNTSLVASRVHFLERPIRVDSHSGDRTGTMVYPVFGLAVQYMFDCVTDPSAPDSDIIFSQVLRDSIVEIIDTFVNDYLRNTPGALEELRKGDMKAWNFLTKLFKGYLVAEVHPKFQKLSALYGKPFKATGAISFTNGQQGGIIRWGDVDVALVTQREGQLVARVTPENLTPILEEPVIARSHTQKSPLLTEDQRGREERYYQAIRKDSYTGLHANGNDSKFNHPDVGVGVLGYLPTDPLIPRDFAHHVETYVFDSGNYSRVALVQNTDGLVHLSEALKVPSWFLACYLDGLSVAGHTRLTSQVRSIFSTALLLNINHILTSGFSLNEERRRKVDDISLQVANMSKGRVNIKPDFSANAPRHTIMQREYVLAEVVNRIRDLLEDFKAIH